MKIFAFTLFLCLAAIIATAQTEVYISTQTGTPFVNSTSSNGIFWNFSFGVEHYMADKVSISLSYRKMFDITGGDNDFDGLSSTDANGNTYDYAENVTSYAIDFESKYFFDAPDDGWYISTGISYQHIETDITVTDYEINSVGAPANSPVNVGSVYSDLNNIFPFTLKLGHRSSGDVAVVDYFFGASYNMGIGNVTYKYEDYFQYAALKRFSFIIGAKLGFKI
jgi:hypothetical protein